MQITTHSARITGPLAYLAAGGKMRHIPIGPCLLERTDGPVILDEEWSALHRGFHAALLAACPSTRQLAWSASLFDQAERYRRFSARFRKTLRRKSNEHKKLMDATLRRDTDTACVLLTDHIRGTQRNVEAAFDAQA